MKGLLTFLAGAAVGAIATALLTPTTGPELRDRIRTYLKKKGIIAAEEIDQLVELIASEVEETNAKKEA